MRTIRLAATIVAMGAVLGLVSVVGPAAAGDTGSRILDSPSRDVYRRDGPRLRSIVPGGNLTTSRSLSGMIGDLNAAGGLGAAPSSGGFDCVLHHERVERTARQLFPTRCDPTVDVDTGYPAFTTR
jgi:hypothetical protein